MDIYFSLIVAAYNVGEFIDKLIDSILIQDFGNFEVIIVNDGSKDNTKDKINKYLNQDKRIRLINQENQGLVNARRVGFSKSLGNYVIFLDGDDWLDQGMLTHYFDLLNKFDLDVIVSGTIFNYKNNVVTKVPTFEKGYYNKEDLEKYIYPNFIYSGRFFNFGISPSIWNKVFKKSLISESIYEVNSKITMGEDAALTFPSIFRASSLYITEKSFYNYRQINTSLSKKIDSDYLSKVELVSNHLFKQINFKDVKTQITYYSLYLKILGIHNLIYSKFKNKHYILSEFVNNIILLHSDIISKKINSSFYFKLLILFIKKKRILLIFLLVNFRKFI
jgi:glycosyltransferase involved in cell wall biosynthesis